MEIKKLNCSSCGSPISIDEDADIVICPYCGSNLILERKEDEITLRLAKNIKKAILDSGEKTNSVIQESSDATQNELRKLQSQQRIQTLQNELSIINSEIRMLERGKQNRSGRKQLKDLILRQKKLSSEIYTLNHPQSKNEEGIKRKSELPKSLKWILIGSGMLFILLCSLISSLSGKENHNINNLSENDIRQTVIASYTQTAEGLLLVAEIQTVEASSSPTAEPVVAPSFQTIQENVDNMTEVQWKSYLPTLDGMWADNWHGLVVDVDKASGSNYKIWVDMDAPETMLSVQDVYLYSISEADAAKITKGAKITFSGLIKECTEFMGDVSIDFENVIYQIE